MFSAVADLCMPNERGSTRCRALFVTLVGQGKKQIQLLQLCMKAQRESSVSFGSG